MQTFANTGILFILLPGKLDWSSWSIEYAMDATLEIKDSMATPISANELPMEITNTFDFQRNLKDNIKAVWELNKKTDLN